MLPVILFASGITICDPFSDEALKKHSSNVLHGIISASGSILSAAKCDYAPKVP